MLFITDVNCCSCGWMAFGVRVASESSVKAFVAWRNAVW